MDRENAQAYVRSPQMSIGTSPKDDGCKGGLLACLCALSSNASHLKEVRVNLGLFMNLHLLDDASVSIF